MRRDDFHFDLPDELIAQFPAEERVASRLLHLAAGGQLADRRFVELPDLLQPGDLLVMNNTRVIPARLWGHKETGGRIEVLVERVLNDTDVLAHVRASKSPGAGRRLLFAEGIEAEVRGRQGELFELRFTDTDASRVTDILQHIGHMPLPPYIERADTEVDQARYQTVYASRQGAVAAPTAGLHFDTAMLETLKAKGVNQVQVTLHVGAGTFQPVRVDDIKEHRMHAEWMELDESVVEAVAETRARGSRVIAVGTTSVRCLETAAASGTLRPWRGDTDIFITPGYRFKVIDALLTNFHLPESTLLMLVSALAGHQNIMQAYRHAVEQRYRFFSYGDAMFIERQRQDER